VAYLIQADKLFNH